MDIINPKYLKLGDNGANVIKLQKGLNKKGFNIKETGLFDAETYRAVAELQRSSGLEINGIVSTQLWQILDGLTPINYFNPTDITRPQMFEYAYNALDMEYYSDIHKKDKIIIMSSATSAHPLSYIGKIEAQRVLLKNKSIGTAFCIGGKLESYWLYEGKSHNINETNGSIYKFFNEENWASFIRTGQPNDYSINSSAIGITLCNMGGLILSKTGVMLNSMGLPVSDKDVFDLGRTWKGYRYFHAYTDEQLNVLYELIRWIISKYSLKISRGIYGQPLWFDTSRDALNNKSGIWNGNNYSDSIDIYPHPQLIEILNKI